MTDVTLSEEDGIRYLHFGTQWVQGAMRISRPDELVLTYTQQMMAWLLFYQLEKEDEIAILGLGAASLLRFCMKHTRNTVHVAEINPRVSAMCRAFFHLPENKRTHIYHEDAEQWLYMPEHIGRYRVLLVDLYDAYAEGPSCSSLHFYQGCYQSLDDEGIMTVNLFGDHAGFDDNVNRISHAFNGNVVVLPEVDEGNVIVLAFKGSMLQRTTVAALMAKADTIQAHYQLPARRWAKSILAELP